MPTICTRTITDLRGMKFLIPSYQRGYRWRDIQVEQLLNDLWEFYQDKRGKPEAWYCLQPLVVAQEKGDRAASVADSSNVLPCGHVLPSGTEAGNVWTVIDGQQRLTTLFIILGQLNFKDLWKTKYETRQSSEDFLGKLTPAPEKDSVSSQDSAINPDFFCMQEAANTVSTWLIAEKKLEAIDKRAFAEFILNNTKFVWYETTEDPYDVFIRMNSGKISLSNAELIKALLLRETRFQDKEGTIKLQQLELAGEWDRTEQALGNDEFWFFVNPDAKSNRFNATRIDFLFELVLRKGFYGLQKIDSYIKEYEKNCYTGFAKFSDFCNKVSSENPEKMLWAEIQFVFRRINSWYDNRSLYHHVGFLMNRKGEHAEKRITTLIGLLEKSQKLSCSDFMETVKQECGEAIINCKLDKLEYDKHNCTLNDVLLLFNLALLDRQNSEQSRYPFKTHTGTAWSLEHIHAKSERTLDDNDIAELNEAMGFDNDGIEELKEQLEKSGVKIADNVDATGWKVICVEQETHGLENLALLERTQNSKFNNKFYPAKRRILSLWEKEVNDGGKKGSEALPAFIPLGTRMAFFKHFSPNKSVSFVWDTSDSKAYFDTIVKMVANYVGVKEDELLSKKGCVR